MKRLSILIIMLLVYVNVFSQRVTLGPRFGVNMATITHFSSLNNESYVQNGQLIRIQTGIVSEFEITDRFSLQTELLYSQKGHKLMFKGDSLDFSIDGYESLKLNYFEVPLLLKYYIGSGGVNFHFNAGPYWSSLLGAKGKLKYDKVIDGELESINEKYDVNNIYGWNDDKVTFTTEDIGLMFGLGFKYDSGIGNILIDFRYSMSYRDLNNWIDVNAMPVDYREFENRVFTISFAYLFNL